MNVKKGIKYEMCETEKNEWMSKIHYTINLLM